MSRQQNSPLSMVTGGVVNAFRRVAMSGSTIIESPNSTPGIGVCQAYTASGGLAAVRMYSEGSCKIEAAGAITAGVDVYPASDGKISATAVEAGPVGKAIEAATDSGDIIEIMPRVVGTLST